MHQSTAPSSDGGYSAEPRGQSALSAASDADLMLGLRERDLCALATLYDRHHGQALALAARLSHDPTQIEQAVEEAFLLVWRMADRYQSAHATPQVWLLGLVAWRCRVLQRAPASVRTDLPSERATLGAREPLDGRLREWGWLTQEAGE